MSKRINLIFTGNFLYPYGMASTKRIQNFVDNLQLHDAIKSIKILLLRQAHTRVGKEERHGTYKGVEYRTIGNDIRPNIKALLKIPKYVIQGIYFIVKNRSRSSSNILYIYGPPNVENIIFVLFAKLIRYRMVFDIVEDYNTVSSSMLRHIFARIKIFSSIFLEKHIYFFADSLIVISNHLYKKFTGIVNNKIEVTQIPVSVDFERFKSNGHKFHDPVTIFYGGSFAEKDGIEYLISAFDEICRKYGNLKLLLSGKGSEKQINKMLDYMDMMQYKSNITYLGYLSDDDYYKTLNSSDILCMTRTDSKFANAGFPFKLGEYLATGNPVVASKVGSVSSYLHDKESAILVEPNSIDSIKTGIEYLVKNPSKALSVGSKGKKVSQEFFDSKIISEKLYNLLFQI